MTAILETQAPPAPGDWDGFLERLHAIEAQALRVARERDEALARAVIAERLNAAKDRRIAELEHEGRELRKANESWQDLARAQAPTVEFDRYREPEPQSVRFFYRRRH